MSIECGYKDSGYSLGGHLITSQLSYNMYTPHDPPTRGLFTPFATQLEVKRTMGGNTYIYLFVMFFFLKFFLEFAPFF